jgi:ATP-dependent exoDNAse (exonuclease V) beta subunit
VSALAYVALGEEQATAEAAEERRLFYVAMTRARERLLLSGAARVEVWANGGAGPIAWLGPRLVPDLSAAPPGVGLTVVGASDVLAREHHTRGSERRAPLEPAVPAPRPAPPAPVTMLSYSSLDEYKRCGYRFYAERVLGIPAVEASGAPVSSGLPATDRGVLVHALLERLDFRAPTRPAQAAVLAAADRALDPADAQDVAELVARFGTSELCARLARATGVLREQRFAFPLGDVLITGAMDVFAREQGGVLVVDYKSDRLAGADPRELVASVYGTQRLVYALAALRAGAGRVEVAHAFLEVPDRPVTASFRRADRSRLDAELASLASGVLERDFRVTDSSQRGVCGGCPAEGGLCAWPLSMTRRIAPDRP